MRTQIQRNDFWSRFNRLDARITRWMATHGITLLRLALGIVYIWFGALKIVPGLSPAEDLVRDTLAPFVPLNIAIPLLTAWEIVIGIGFLTGQFMRLTILLLFLHLPGTVSPMFLLPDRVFTIAPFGLTLEGQYIVKNVLIAAAGIVVGATVRGGGLVDDPEAFEEAGEIAEQHETVHEAAR